MARPWNQTDRGEFVHGFGARIITGDDQAAVLLPWGETRRAAEPEDLSGKPRPSQPDDCASAKPSADAVAAAHAEFIAALAGHPPRTIPIDADAIDLEDRADHLNMVFGALLVYVAVILDDTAQNVPGGLDFRDIEAILSDLASDVTGAIQHAAEDMAGRIA
jgi:hypothetical protein